MDPFTVKPIGLVRSTRSDRASRVAEAWRGEPEALDQALASLG